MKALVVSLAIWCVLGAGGCGAGTATVAPPRSVTHVVVCWLKSPGNQEHRQQLIAATESFANLPGLLHVTAGEPLPSTRPVVVTDYDVALSLTFRDGDALATYQRNAHHQAMRREVLEPLVQKIRVYDFRSP